MLQLAFRAHKNTLLKSAFYQYSLERHYKQVHLNFRFTVARKISVCDKGTFIIVLKHY